MLKEPGAACADAGAFPGRAPLSPGPVLSINPGSWAAPQQTPEVSQPGALCHTPPLPKLPVLNPPPALRQCPLFFFPDSLDVSGSFQKKKIAQVLMLLNWATS